MIIQPFKTLGIRLALLFCVFLTHLSWANTIQSVRVWPSPDETRVVIDMQSEPTYSYFTLTNPDRLVVDIREATLGTQLPVKVTNSPVLSQLRKSTPSQSGSYRLVFELKNKTTENLFKLAPTPGGQYGHRLVIDLAHNLSKTPIASTSSSSTSSASTSTTATTSSHPEAKKPTPTGRDMSHYQPVEDAVIAIDAGHGGEDPGSIGPGRRYEKNVTLAVAKKLAAQINRSPGMRAILTRNGDYFVDLNRRSEIARHNKAHLLISIHADAFNSPQPRGASVFVLNTRRANTEISRWVENHEQQSQLLGGAGAVLAKNNSDRNVSQTLLDLQFSHSQKEGYKLATDILHELGKVAYLHKREPVNASLAVLKSPDIPSVLVETGFISNPAEERLLFQSSHQDKLARAITNALTQYFKANPPEGTLFAHPDGKNVSYKVQRGDVLSLIAQKYGTSTAALMRANDLKSSAIHVGQVLAIPSLVVTNRAERPDSTSTKTISYVVVKGDYLGKIAQQYHVSVDAIKRENNLRSETLTLGQTLRITAQVKDLPLRQYTVKRGDYLGKIAAQYHVSIEALRQANQLRSDQVRVGQTLVIPTP